MRKLSLFIIPFLLLAYGCCLKSVTAAPEVRDIQFKENNLNKIDYVGGKITFELTDCCIKGPEKDIILSLEQELVANLDNLKRKKITLEEYNQNRKATVETLDDIQNKCNRKVTPAMPSVLKVVGGYTAQQKEEDIRKALEKAEQVLKIIKQQN